MASRLEAIASGWRLLLLETNERKKVEYSLLLGWRPWLVGWRPLLLETNERKKGLI